MCGIAGYIKISGGPDDLTFLHWFNGQLEEISERGTDAWGVCWILEPVGEDKTWIVVRQVELGNDISLLDRWVQVRKVCRAGNMIVRGCVLNFRNIPVTEFFGGEIPQDQIQPFYHGRAIVAHNGQLSNDKQLFERFNFERMASSGDHDVDSYMFLQMYQAAKTAKPGDVLLNSLASKEAPELEPFNVLPKRFLAAMEGSWAVSILDVEEKRLILSRTFLGLDLATLETSDEDLYLAWGSQFTDVAQNFCAIDTSKIKEVCVSNFPTSAYALLDMNALIAQCAHDQVNRQFGKTNKGSYTWLATPARTLMRRMCRDQMRCLETDDLLPISRVAVVASGGLDSTVALTMACQQYREVHILHFQYGARAETPEYQAITKIARHLIARYPSVSIKVELIDLSFLKQIGGSSLTDPKKKVAKGELGVEKATEWVPARNAVMMALAAAYCDRYKVQGITLGLNREESAVYCDNSSEFFQAMEKAFDLGTHSKPKMLMPLAQMMKHQIVAKGFEIDAPMELSWSCYNNEVRNFECIRCGDCGPCLMRRRAYAMNGQRDPAAYLCDDPITERILDARRSEQTTPDTGSAG